MNAQQLLDELIAIRERMGGSLSNLDVQFGYTVYDDSIPYDRGLAMRRYADSVEITYEDDYGNQEQTPTLLIR